MQLFVLVLVLAVYAEDALRDPSVTAPDISPAIVVLGAYLLLGIAYTVVCRLARRAMDQPQAHRALRRLDRATFLFRQGVLVVYLLGLHLGLLLQIRWLIERPWRPAANAPVGDPILIDELLALLPPLLMLAWGWWAYYPIDRRLRESQFIRMVDSGKPVYPIWTRRQFILAQFRHNVGLVLAPLIALLGWSEVLNYFGDDVARALGEQALPLVHLAGAGLVFLFAPVMIRGMWDTIPLPEGSLRQSLLAMCRVYGVGVRELLLWRTFGGLVNAAVMGLVRPLRYILLSDALLDQVPQKEVEAVMAHELGHVRRHHIFWMLVVVVALLAALTTGWTLLIEHFAVRFVPEQWYQPDNQHGWEVLAAGASIVCWALAFGWISRRFERQADTFAVQHLAIERSRQTPMSDAARPHIEHADVLIMTQALEHVAVLNYISPTRRSWRHGSIAWRQEYLRTLVGQRVDELAIDRLIFWVKLAAALVLGGMLAMALVTQGAVSL